MRADALECFIRRIGIDDTEFTDDFGAGRVHLYAGGDGTNSFMTGGTFSAATTLWSNRTKLASYDMIGFSCEGSTSEFVAQKPQTSVDNIADYANSGGRLLFSHLHVYWLQQSPDFSGTATYVGPLDRTRGESTSPSTRRSKGMALAQWLAGSVVMASPTLGRISADRRRAPVTSVIPPTVEWMYLPTNPQDSQRAV